MPAQEVIRLGLFLLLTGSFGWASREHLRNPSSYGFYRFFAFASIFALVMLQAENWFMDPASARQIASWMLLALSAPLALHSLRLHRQLRQMPVDREGRPVLITWGVYRHLRHPLYASLFYFVWGTFLKSIDWASWGLALLTSLLLLKTAQVEEAENRIRFGEAYEIWMRSRKRFIPFVL